MEETQRGLAVAEGKGMIGHTLLMQEVARRGLTPAFLKYNPNHEPAGSSEGGQFSESGGPTQEIESDSFSSMSPSQARRGLHSRATLSGAQKVAIGDYTTTGSWTLNAALRDGKGKFPRSETVDVPRFTERGDTDSASVTLGSMANALDAAIADTSASRPIVLYRGVDRDSVSVGQTFTDHGYTSATLTPGKAFGASDRFVVKIEVPAGSKALYLGSLSNVESEDEVILPRGSRFQVTAVRKTGITVRLLP